MVEGVIDHMMPLGPDPIDEIGVGTRPIPGEPEGDFYPLGRQCIEDLRGVTAIGTRIERQDHDRLGRRETGDFTNVVGEPLAKGTVIKQYKRHLAAAGLPVLRFHDLRHSCASLLVAQGVHPRVVMEILGHSTITLTMNTYSHVLPQAQRDATNLMDRLFTTPAQAGD